MKKLLVGFAFIVLAQLGIAGFVLAQTTMNCFECHRGGGVDNPHHVTDDAAVGNCEHCHNDPRPDPGWTGAFPGDNGYNSCSDVPTQLACRECHVTFNGNYMEVTRFTRSDYVSYAVEDWGRQVVHTIPNTVGQINNYGICLGCHTTNTNPSLNITVLHARPDKKDTSNTWVFGENNGEKCTGVRERWEEDSPEVLKLAKYAPGRSSGTISSFNRYKVPGFGWNTGYGDWDACSDEAQYASSPLNFVLIHVPAQLAGGGAAGADVPVFASLQRETAEGTMAACSASETQTEVINSTRTFTLPYNAVNIQFTLKGGGGGGGRPDWENNQTAGQPGSMVTAAYPSTAYTGTVLRIYVGRGGTKGPDTYTGAPGGGGYPAGKKGYDGEYWGPDEWALGGAGGGGASAVMKENYTDTLARARGGNGGKSSDWYYEELNEMMPGGSGGAGGGSNMAPGGTVNPTGGAPGGNTLPSDGGNGQVIITWEVP